VAAHVRQHHVEENEIERLGANQLERCAAVLRLGHAEARQPEVDGAEQPDRPLVVHDEQAAPGTLVAWTGEAQRHPRTIRTDKGRAA